MRELIFSAYSRSFNVRLIKETVHSEFIRFIHSILSYPTHHTLNGIN